MNKTFKCLIPILLSFVSLTALVAQNEWDDVSVTQLNRELARTIAIPFESETALLTQSIEQSNYYQSLNGTWKFNWVKHPDERPVDFYKPEFNVNGWENIPVPVSWNIHGIQKDGSLKYGVPIYVNQPVIFQHKVAVDDWRGGVMRTDRKSVV